MALPLRVTIASRNRDEDNGGDRAHRAMRRGVAVQMLHIGARGDAPRTSARRRMRYGLAMKVAAALIVALAACAGSPAPRSAAPAACAGAGAGTLEMRGYFLVLLRRGPAWTPERTPATEQLFAGHMANIEAMARTGALVLAGPTDAPETDRTAIAGIFVFGVATQAEVEALIGRDPAIAAGRLVPEILPWYGPAGLTYPGQAAVRGDGASP